MLKEKKEKLRFSSYFSYNNTARPFKKKKEVTFFRERKRFRKDFVILLKMVWVMTQISDFLNSMDCERICKHGL